MKQLNFIYFEKATKFWKIFTLLLSVCTVDKKVRWRFCKILWPSQNIQILIDSSWRKRTYLKAPSTKVTGKRLVSSVLTAMCDQIWWLTKCFTTDHTFVRFLTCKITNEIICLATYYFFFNSQFLPPWPIKSLNDF